uniref:RCC1-like domain-containing protein n=1 Tax=Arundo donax TaxID=35708 RepID=A0A0A9GX48_ARUDO
MDATDSRASMVIEFHKTVNENSSDASPSHPAEDRSQRHCFRNEVTVQCPLTANQSILLNVLSSYELDPKDLAALEATCKFFRDPACFTPDVELSLPELAAFDMCRQRAMFRLMKHEESERLKQRCGGSWKLVLRYMLIGERNYRREKSQVIAGPGHSIVVTTKGDVYSFGSNCSGQLGLGNTEDQFKPCLIRSLQGIRIIQAAVGSRRTMLVSNTGNVYTFGQDIFGGLDSIGGAEVSYTSSPKLLESLKGVFVVQASIGGFFSAVLSREGQVYTFSWGRDARLGHNSDTTDVEPRLLSGPLEDALVVQIAAGTCYLLMLAYQPTGMSVYSVGCGLGGKLGHGCKIDEGIPKLIEHFQALNVKPLSISAGTYHCAALACDGRVFTWGWSHYGCLGHGDETECMTLPTAVEGLRGVKAMQVSAGQYTTFVVADNGDVYSFGWAHSFNLGFQVDVAENVDVRTPKLVTSFVLLDEKVVQISATDTWDWPNRYMGGCHTIALTESGKLYSFGEGTKGQLGIKLADGQVTRPAPARVTIDLI